MQRRTPTATPAPPDAHVALLTEHDILLHQSLGGFHRTDHRRTLSPGSTLLLYTDGAQGGLAVGQALGPPPELVVGHLVGDGEVGVDLARAERRRAQQQGFLLPRQRAELPSARG
ncbi:hypothetical protein ACFZCP_20475 [Streptomyces sp. NPDC007971]|uniref:hypothetical protein n=1 Tax=Streptomyces sp. NPDC007971 TaxID=3364799 RepID=UPI0036E61FB3